MLSPWIIRTFTFAPLLPLRYRALPFLTLRVGANFAGASKPHDTIRSITHKPPCIFLKTATIPTYLWHFQSHSEIYSHATFHHSVYHDTFIIVILLSMIM